MIQVLGKKSPSKRQFIYTLAGLTVKHYKEYEVYTENFMSDSEEYVDGLKIERIENYAGAEKAIIESVNKVLPTGKLVYYLTPYYPEIKLFIQFLSENHPEEIIIIYGEHIHESTLNQKYLKGLIADYSPSTKAEILTIEWDKIDKLLADEGFCDGYYKVASLSKDYKNALMEILIQSEGIQYKESKKYFRPERRLF